MVMFFDMVVELQCSTKFVVFWSIFAFLSVIAKEEQKKKKKRDVDLNTFVFLESWVKILTIKIKR